MKIILTGANGLVGKEVLRQCTKHIYITHIYCITRAPLPIDLRNHSKVSEIIHPDMTDWPSDQLASLKEAGVNGCIWCVGGSSVSKFANQEEARNANVSLALGAAEAFVRDLIFQPSDAKAKPFRFVYMSVSGAERDGFRSLWTNGAMRKIKGEAEKGLCEVADGEQAQGMLEVYFLRLGSVQNGGQTMANIAFQTMGGYVSVERVGRCAINTVLDGRAESLGGRIVENSAVLGDDWADVNTLTL